MALVAENPFHEYEAFIPDFDLFNERLCTPLPRCLRANTLRITPSELTDVLCGQGYRVEPTFLADYLLSIAGLHHPGLTLEGVLGTFFSQALTSAMAVIALDPKPQEFVCDLCAAPGCKTTHMAQLMNNRGLILANDNKERRIRALEYNIRRLGILNVVTTLYAAQNFPRRWRFDRVLADVPCSGEGTVRFSSSSLRWSRKRVERYLLRIQRALILRAFDVLAEPGILLYSTCTYNPDENEGVVQHLLDNRPAELLPIDLSAPHAPGLRQWRDKTYDRQMEKCWRIYPHQVNSVGFFLAKVRRRPRPDGTSRLL